MKLTGIVQSVEDGVGFTLFVSCTDTHLLTKQAISACGVWLDDGRALSQVQREAICATCNDIGAWTGHFEAERYFQTLRFCELYDCELFSLSRETENCASMTTARAFLTYLIEFCIEHSVPCSEKLLKRCEDIGHYVYCCLIHKTCCICGKDVQGVVELHHCGATNLHASSKVGMGRDRHALVHQGLYVMPLCGGPFGHHAEAEHLGQTAFEEKHHIFGVQADAAICEIYNLKES